MFEKLDINHLTRERLAKTIDHSLLKPTVTDEDLEIGCKIAKKYNVATACVKPYHVKLAKKFLEDSDVKVSVVVGFPHGGTLTSVKSKETEEVIKDGADELDMVLNIGALKSGRYDYVKDDIKAVVTAAQGALVKVILENCYLTKDEKIIACKLAEEAGADYVKTSTGFGTGGATVEDVKLMYDIVGPRLGVKAAGGVRSLEAALAVIEAGATRIGATATVVIMEEWEKIHNK